MGKPKPLNYTRGQADAAVSTLLNLAAAILEHENYQDVYDEAQHETRGRAERFKTLERKAAKVERCLLSCKITAVNLRLSISKLKPDSLPHI